MTLCLSLTCQQPINPDDVKFCQSCGAKLRLGDRYRTLKLLGQGGFGRTFLAIDEQDALQAHCVVKQFLMGEGGASLTQKALELFRQEAARLRELGDHPQIPDLLAYYEIDRRPYIVQSFVAGITLAQELAKRGTFSELKIQQLLAELLPVLQFIHDHRVVHRDIKPENIIRPSAGQLNLVDFGAAKFVSVSSLRRTGTVIGSAGYAAPEQTIGKATFASDLYSLGVTCIHLMTGILPFDLYSCAEGRWVWRDYLPMSVSDDLGQILDGMLATGLNQRYQSAAVILRDLQALSPAPVTVLPESPVSVKPPLPLSPSITLPPHYLTWECVQTLCEHDRPVLAIAIDPTGKTFASGGADKTIKFWHLKDLSPIDIWDMSSAVLSLAFNYNGQFLASSSVDNTVKVWIRHSASLMYNLTEHRSLVSSLCFFAQSSQGSRLVAGGDNGIVKIWHLGLTTVPQTLNHPRSVTAVAVSPDGAFIASGSSDNLVRIWETQTGNLLHILEGHSRDINAIAISSDGQHIASGSSDTNIKLWNLHTGALVHTFCAHSSGVKCLTIDPTSQVLASGGQDCTIHLWDMQTGKRMHTLTGHTKDINAIAFTPNGSRLLSGSSDRTIKIWQIS